MAWEVAESRGLSPRRVRRFLSVSAAGGVLIARGMARELGLEGEDRFVQVLLDEERGAVALRRCAESEVGARRVTPVNGSLTIRCLDLARAMGLPAGAYSVRVPMAPGDSGWVYGNYTGRGGMV